MPVRIRATDAGARRGRQLVLMIGHEVLGARHMAGVSQDTLGGAVDMSGSEVGRIERGEAPWLTIVDASKLLSAVGLDLWAKAYAAGPPIRDSAHVHLLDRFEARLPSAMRREREWPVPLPGDRRAIDLMLFDLPLRTGVEAETRLTDEQALERDLNLKRRDARLERVFLLVADSAWNREVIRASMTLPRMFPLETRAVLAALKQGRDPGADGIVIL